MSKKNNTTRTFIRFTGIGLQLGLSIYLGNLLGVWLDGQYPNEGEYWSKGVTLFVIFGSIYSIIRQVQKISNEN
jgi:hypothetical protein